MGNNCCNKRAVIEVTNKKPLLVRRRSSILLEKYSKQSDYKKKYEFISILGNGGFGKVRLYRDRNCTTMKYAIKTLKKDFLNPHSIQSLIQEVKILATLDHPNIVKYFETYEDDHYLHIVMEYIPGDNLFKVISNRKINGFSERDASEILSYLFQAVLFLHKNKIVHRDIKPENILFSLPGKYTSLKLIDFGLSTSLSKDNYRVGSPYYMAPEMLKGEYDYNTDTWSIGVILFVMITGTYPFPGKDQNEVFERIKKGVYDVKLLEKQKASEEVKDLIKKLLVHDINKRLPIEEALNHSWFTKNKTNNDLQQLIDDNILDSISNFAKRNLIQKEILFYLAKISSESEVTRLKQAFSEFDKDKSGTIESEEIVNIFDKLGKKIDTVGVF